MRIVRGRGIASDTDPDSASTTDAGAVGEQASIPDADSCTVRDRASQRLDRVAQSREPTLQIWCPPRQIAFGRRDVRSEGFAAAQRIARENGYVPIERRVGGRAVAHTGGTLAFALGVPTVDSRSGIADRYETVTRLLTATFRDHGAAVEPGEPPNAYCPGRHSIRVVDGGKVSGIAQRVRRDVALVSGCLTVRHRDVSAIVDVLTPVYDALGVPFDPETVGCLAASGGPTTLPHAADAIETALSAEVWCGDRESTDCSQ